MYPYLGDTGIWLYDFLNVFGFAVLLIYNLTQINKKKLFLGKVSTSLLNSTKNNKTRAEVILALSEILIISIFQYALSGKINRTFGNWVETGSNYFGLLFFAPFLISIACFLLSIDIFKQFDCITPAFPLALVFAKLACFCYGCCNGIECSFGLYNYDTQLVEFPVQLVETGLALCIFVFLMFWRKKAKEGTMFPTYLIIYSATRFFSEFLRHEENVLWILKKYHLLCLAGIVIGCIELLIVKKYKNKIIAFYDNSFDFFAAHLHRYALKNGLIKEKNIVHHNKRKKK